MRALAAALLWSLSLGGACTDPPPPFTYELDVSPSTMPKVAIDGDATFVHQTWDFASYTEATETFVLDVTYGEPANHLELRAEGCHLEGHGQPGHDLDRLAHQKVTLGPTPTTIATLWCTDDVGGSWGFIN